MDGRPASHEGLVRTVAEAPEGNRNHALFWAACQAFAEGAEPGVLAALEDAARHIGLAEWEIRRTVESARRRA